MYDLQYEPSHHLRDTKSVNNGLTSVPPPPSSLQGNMQALIQAPSFMLCELHFPSPHLPIIDAHLVPTHDNAWERRLEQSLIAPTSRDASLIRNRYPPRTIIRLQA